MEEDNSQKPPKKYYNLVLSGGGIKSISQLGAIKQLIDSGYLTLSEIKSIAGTSAGAIISILLTLGFTVDEIWDFIMKLNIPKLVEPNILIFLDKMGIESGQKIYDVIEGIIHKKTGIKHINFRQLYEITGINLTVVGSCLTTREAVYFNHLNYPNFKVSMAVRISISIPFFFTPVVIDNLTYIDGGVTDNYPMKLFMDDLEHTIGILICDEYSTSYIYPDEYIMAILNLITYNYYRYQIFENSQNTIKINQKILNISLFHFNVDDDLKMKLFNLGIESTLDYLNNTH